MAKLLKRPKAEAAVKPKPARAPAGTDPELLEAAQRTRSAALRRRGRLSTIATDGAGARVAPEKIMTGSSGVKLGA